MDLSNQGHLHSPQNVAAHLTSEGREGLPQTRAALGLCSFRSVFENCKYVWWTVCIAPSGFCMNQHFKGRTTATYIHMHKHIHPHTCTTEHFIFFNVFPTFLYSHILEKQAEAKKYLRICCKSKISFILLSNVPIFWGSLSFSCHVL